MKIDPLKQANMIMKYEKTVKAQPDSKINLNNDKVEISKDYAIYEKALKSLKEIEGFNDIKKLDSIREQIAKGDYKIDFEKLAQNIVSKSKNDK